MRRRTALSALPGLLTAFGVSWPDGDAMAQAPADFDPADLALAEQLRTCGLADTRALALVRELTQTIGARPAGSAADARAVVWAQQQLQALGLERVRAEPLSLRVWRRGPGRAEVVAPERRPLVMAALGNSVGTPDGGIEAEIAYYADFAALKADTSDRAKGRIVFIDQTTARSRDGAGYGAAVPARFGSAAEAGRRGALAVVIRSIGTDREPIAHTGGMRYDDAAARIPAVAVSVPDAEAIAGLVRTGTPVRLRLDVATQLNVDAESANVIAEVPGTGPQADEVVVLSAHLDSWDLGEGAVDNAAGVGIVSAAAALVRDVARAAGRPLRRTLRVVLFANEENGFDGAQAYSRQYGTQRHQLIGESDFGAGPIYALATRVPAPALPAMAAIGQALAPLGIALGDNKAAPSPDAAFLMRRHQWPAIDLSQDGTTYFDVHHTAHDTFARMDTRHLGQNVAAWAVLGFLAAQAPVSFGG